MTISASAPAAPDKHREMDVRSVRIRTAGEKGTPPNTPGSDLQVR